MKMRVSRLIILGLLVCVVLVGGCNRCCHPHDSECNDENVRDRGYGSATLCKGPNGPVDSAFQSESYAEYKCNS